MGINWDWISTVIKEPGL